MWIYIDEIWTFVNVRFSQFVTYVHIRWCVTIVTLFLLGLNCGVDECGLMVPEFQCRSEEELAELQG